MTAIDDTTGLFAPVAAPRAEKPNTRTLITPRTSRAVEDRRVWERAYRTRLRINDTVIALLTCTLASLISLFLIDPALLRTDPWILARIPLVTAFGWLLMLSLFGTRQPAVMGTGATEYKRVAHATAMAFGFVAIAFVVFQWEGLRTQLFFALPVGVTLLIFSRWMWRRWLLRQRVYGGYASRTIVVGNRDDVEHVVRTLGDKGVLGYRVVGAAILDDEVGTLNVDSVSYPLMHSTTWVSQAPTLEADTIIVASQPSGEPDYIKHLAWQMEGTAAELVLSSRLGDIAGPRMSLRPVEGLPLIHVQIPDFEGGSHAFKRALDIVVSSVALTLFAPFAALIALAIKLDSPGPVFFLQRRVGRDGQEFRMVKFRSMRTDAEAQLATLMASNEGAGPLFKMHNDPRVTRVGRILRKYSLDEIPQFWNALVGDMSVVGPRPPLPAEVTAYDGTVIRRLYIKPGITGPWQVGGRSDLSWEESVRLDLRYVENWSVIGDLIIMWRTAKVMIRPDGAY